MAENIKITIEAEDRASPVLSSISSSLNSLNRSVASNTSAMGSSFAALNKSLDNLESAFTAVAGAFFVKETISFIDKIQTLDNRLRLVTNSADELNATYSSLLKVANETRQGIAPTIDLYAKLALTAKEVGVNQSDLTTIVEAYNKTLLKSGSSTQGAAAATYQFAQAMGSGRLQGEELRSQLEQNSSFMTTLSRTTGLTYQQLRILASDGFLNSSIVAQALKDDIARLTEEIGKMPKTVGQALTGLSNAFQSTIRDILNTSGAGGILAGAIDVLTNNIKPLTYALIALATAFAIAALIKAVVFIVEAFTVATVAATTAVRGLGVALTFLAATPLGRVISVIGVAVGALATLGTSQDETGNSTSMLSKGIDFLKEKLGFTSKEAKTTSGNLLDLDDAQQKYNDAIIKNLPISAEMAELLKKYGIEAKISKTPFDQLTDSIQRQIDTSGMFSDERKRSMEVQKSLDDVIEKSRKQGIYFTDSEVANMKARLEAKYKERDESIKATDEIEKAYKGYLDFVKSNQDKSLSETDRYNKDIQELEDHRRKNSRMNEEEYQDILAAMRAKYSEKYRKLIEDTANANLTTEQKFSNDLQKLEDDARNNRLSKDINFEEAKDALRRKYVAQDLALQKAAKESLLTDQEKFDQAIMEAQTKLNIGLYKNTEEYLAQVDALKANYTKRYRDMEKQAQDMSLTDTQKYQKALQQIEDDFLNGRFQSYQQYTQAKQDLDVIHNKKLWDEAERYRIQEGGAFAAYQQRLSELQAAQLAGRFQNEQQYQSLVREATKKLNDDVATTYSTMYSTVSNKLLEMLGVNKEKWPMMKEVIRLFGVDSDAILKDLFRQGIQYLLGFTNPGGQAITTFGGVLQKIFGSGGTGPQAVSSFGTSSTSTISSFINFASSGFSNFGSSLARIFSGAYNSITSIFGNIGSFLSRNVLSLLDDIISGASSAVSALARVIGGGGGSGSGGFWSSVISIGSSIISWFSDERMKKNIQYKASLGNGLNLYDFQYRAPYNQVYGFDTKTGVIAQDVKGIYPQAVTTARNGMYMVDYSQLGIPTNMLRFAKGGVIDRPTRFSMGLVGEAGPEAILPLSRTSTGDLGVKADMSDIERNNINVAFTINAVDTRGIDTLLLEKRSLITNMVREAVQRRGVKI